MYPEFFSIIMDIPASICVSVNDEVVHGIEKGPLFKEGDIVNLDARD